MGVFVKEGGEEIHIVGGFSIKNWLLGCSKVWVLVSQKGSKIVGEGTGLRKCRPGMDLGWKSGSFSMDLRKCMFLR